MKTTYFLLVLLALTLVPENVDGWFFRSVRRIRVSPYHTLGCMAACKWARSWACKVCKRKRGLDVRAHPAEDADDVAAMKELDLNGDGFADLHEIAVASGLKPTNMVQMKKFHAADGDGDGKLNAAELDDFNFVDKDELVEAVDEDGAEDAGDDDVVH